MIVGFRDRWLREFFVRNRSTRNVPSDLGPRLFRKLQFLDDASSDADLRVPPSNHFEKLRANLVVWHAVCVNDQWRLIFRWDSAKGEAGDVHLG